MTQETVLRNGFCIDKWVLLGKLQQLSLRPNCLGMFPVLPNFDSILTISPLVRVIATNLLF